MAPRNRHSNKQSRKRAASTSPTRSPKNQKRPASSSTEQTGWRGTLARTSRSKTGTAVASSQEPRRKRHGPQAVRSSVHDLPEELLVKVFTFVSTYIYHFETPHSVAWIFSKSQVAQEKIFILHPRYLHCIITTFFYYSTLSEPLRATSSKDVINSQ
jgi:hypothetical protein